MQPGSRRDRIIEAMRVSSSPLDDDQLAERAGISPRQGVNQICRELERAGLARRRPGAAGKVVNEWLGNGDRQPDGDLDTPQLSRADWGVLLLIENVRDDWPGRSGPRPGRGLGF